jgi:hypothetical protein
MCYKMRTLTKLGVAMTDRDDGRPGEGASASNDGCEPAEQFAALAARLGITRERLFKELASLAFSDMSRIVDWAPGENGLRIKLAKDLDPADRAAVAEIIASASTGRIYRVKLHDKRGALGLLMRCVEIDKPVEDDGEDPFDYIVRELDRRAAESRMADLPSETEQTEETAAR